MGRRKLCPDDDVGVGEKHVTNVMDDGEEIGKASACNKYKMSKKSTDLKYTYLSKTKFS